jgi:hypothetical protein
MATGGRNAKARLLMKPHSFDDDTRTSVGSDYDSEKEEEPASIVIVGAGIVGLVLALALKEQCGVTVELYDKVEEFHEVRSYESWWFSLFTACLQFIPSNVRFIGCRSWYGYVHLLSFQLFAKRSSFGRDI